MRFAFCLEFGEHLTPGSLTNGMQTDAQLVAIELAHLTGQSPALRASGNLILFHGREGLFDELVSTSLHHVRLPQPDRDEKILALNAMRKLYPDAQFESGLTDEEVANLTSNTPNRGVEALLRASHRTGKVITAKGLAEQKTATWRRFRKAH